jgi:hypothetical protein
MSIGYLDMRERNAGGLLKLAIHFLSGHANLAER